MAADSKRTAPREVRYTATPKAKQDYNNDGVVNALDDPFVNADDDFGFNESWQQFEDNKNYSPTRQTDV